MIDSLKSCAALIAFIAMLGLMILEMTAIIWFPVLCVWCWWMAAK